MTTESLAPGDYVRVKGSGLLGIVCVTDRYDSTVLVEHMDGGRVYYPWFRLEPKTSASEPITLTVTLAVPNDDYGSIDFTNTIEVLDYLAERHEDLEIDFA